MISQAFKVPDQHQQLRRPGAVPAGQGPSAQPHQKRAQGVLQAVDALLLPPQLPGRVGVHLRQGLNPPAQVVPGQVRHFQGQLPAPFQGRRRSRQQTGIRLRRGRLLSGQQPQHRPLQQSRRWKQQHRTQQVESRVDNGHPRQGHGPVQNGRSRQRLHQPEHPQPDTRPGQVEQQMHQSRPPGAVAGPHGGQHRRHAGADVLAHDDGDGGPHRHLSAGGQGLQYPHRGGAGLDHRRQHRPGQHPQQRAAEGREQLPEPLRPGQARYSGGHDLHALHQNGKAQQGLACVPAAALSGQIRRNAPQTQQRHKARRAQQPPQDTAALQTSQAQQPGRHRGAHVGAHDDPHRLAEGQHTGVHEAHHHHHGRR